MNNVTRFGLASLVVVLTTALCTTPKKDDNKIYYGKVVDVTNLEVNCYEQFMTGLPNGTPYALMTDAGAHYKAYLIPGGITKDHSYVIDPLTSDVIKVGEYRAFTTGINPYYSIILVENKEDQEKSIRAPVFYVKGTQKIEFKW